MYLHGLFGTAEGEISERTAEQIAEHAGIAVRARNRNIEKRVTVTVKNASEGFVIDRRRIGLAREIKVVRKIVHAAVRHRKKFLNRRDRRSARRLGRRNAKRAERAERQSGK